MTQPSLFDIEETTPCRWCGTALTELERITPGLLVGQENQCTACNHRLADELKVSGDRTPDGAEPAYARVARLPGGVA